MFKSSKSKKGLKNIVSFLLVAAILITGALAYLTATDSKENKFTVGNVSIELTEPNWNEENGKNIVPGETIAKDPQIENTSLNDAYVYIMVTVPKKDQITVNENGSAVVKDNLQLFTYDVNDNWTLINSKSDDANENNYYVYAYNTALAPQGKTEPLFEEVTFANIVSGQIESTEELEILVNGYAIQSNNVYNAEGNPATAEEAWDIYATQNGWDFPLEVPDGYSAMSFVNEKGTVVHTEVAEIGTPVDMYFDSTLAKDGFTFDWVDSTTNEVAYSGMPMPEENTNLEATYTETGLGSTPSNFLQYHIRQNEAGELYAGLTDFRKDNAPTELTDVIIPSSITFTVPESPEEDKTIAKKYYLDNADGSQTLWFEIEGNPSSTFLSRGKTYTVPVTEIAMSPSANAVHYSHEIAKSVVFPDTITIIGGMFSYENVKEIILPYGVVGAGWITNCNLERLVIPNSVKSIGFTNVTIDRIVLPKSIEKMRESQFDRGIVGELVINSDIILTNARGPEIDEDSAFLWTSNESPNVPADVKTIRVNEGVTKLPGKFIFQARNTTTLYLPSTLTEIEQYELYSTYSDLETIYFAGTEEQWNSICAEDCKIGSTSSHPTIYFNSTSQSGQISETLAWEITTDGVLTITGTGDMPAYSEENSAPWVEYSNCFDTAVIEDGITSVSAYSFANCTSLSNVYLPISVTSIGDLALHNNKEPINVYYAGTYEQFASISIGDIPTEDVNIVPDTAYAS